MNHLSCIHAVPGHRLNTCHVQDGQTPLHMAASGRLDGDMEGRLACITHLLAAKANLELPDKVLALHLGAIQRKLHVQLLCSGTGSR